MIYLIRVYRNDQIQPVHVEAFDRGDPLPSTKHPKGCRCLPTFSDYHQELAEKYDLGDQIADKYLKFESGYIQTDTIYPTPTK